MIRKSNSSSYGFVFSDNIKDWQTSSKKQLRDFVKRIKDEGR